MARADTARALALARLEILVPHLDRITIYPVQSLVEDPDFGFPDDNNASGPTILADATFLALAREFSGVNPDQFRRRFRANLLLDGVEPFWDDRLYADALPVVRFRIVVVVFERSNPCQRCVVPTRSPTSGNTTRGLQEKLGSLRQSMLPTWAKSSRFDNFCRLAVNTRVHNPGPGVLRIGDEVEFSKPSPPNSFERGSPRAGFAAQADCAASPSLPLFDQLADYPRPNRSSREWTRRPFVRLIFFRANQSKQPAYTLMPKCRSPKNRSAIVPWIVPASPTCI